MKSTELPQLASRLGELADYYAVKAPSTGALRVWLDALAEAVVDDVLFVLTDWPKSRSKFPLASEVLTLTRSRLSDRIEAEARRTAMQPAPTTNEIIDAAARRATSAIARTELAAMVATLGHGEDETHKRWAYRLREREASGDDLSPLQRRAWREALRFDQLADDEARIERAAIQAEATAKETTQ